MQLADFFNIQVGVGGWVRAELRLGSDVVLQVSNPIIMLTQETSKTMLTKNSDKGMYQVGLVKSKGYASRTDLTLCSSCGTARG